MKKKYVKYKNHVIIFEREDSEHPFDKSKYSGIEVFSHCITGQNGQLAFKEDMLLNEFMEAITKSAYDPLAIFPLYGTELDFSLEFEPDSFIGYLQVSKKTLKAPLLIETFVDDLNIWISHSHYYIKINSLDGCNIVSLNTPEFYDYGLDKAMRLINKLVN